MGARSRRAYSKPSPSGTSRSRAPQTRKAGQRTRSRSGRGSSPSRARPALPTSVCCEGPSRKPRTRVGIERLGVGRPPQAEGQPAKPRPAREGAPEARHHLRGANGCGDGEPDLRAARGRDDARRRDQRERGHVLGLLDGQPERDDAAHGVAENGAGQHSLELGDLVDVARVRGDSLDVLERLARGRDPAGRG